MKELQPDEIELIGKHLFQTDRMVADDVECRILWLVKEKLNKIAISPVYGAWETLYQDPGDGRYWEKTYPHGDLQGGGPLSLCVMSKVDASAKYKIDN